LFTLNIRHGGGSRIDRITGLIESLGPDVVVLTEFRENA
jgi:hypothetical protein